MASKKHFDLNQSITNLHQKLNELGLFLTFFIKKIIVFELNISTYPFANVPEWLNFSFFSR